MDLLLEPRCRRCVAQRRAARAARHRRRARSRRASRRRRARIPAASAAVIGYDEALAHLMQGGVDALLVPSRFEPCGLTQLCALRYGAMPVVARVGGLADTVIDANEMALAAGVGTGVQFAPVDARAPRARDRAARSRCGATPAAWRRLQARAMATDVGWRRPAKQYAALYRELVARAPRLTHAHASVPAAPSRSALTLVARRRQRRRLLGARERDRAVPVRRRRARPRSSASRCPSAPATCSTASSPASRRRALRIARARPLRSARRPPLQSARSCWSIPTRARSTGRSRCIPRCSASGADGATRNDADSAPFVPKAIVTRAVRAGAGARAPRMPWADTILYELHVRGFTRAHPGVPEALRGTCAGLAHPAAIDASRRASASRRSS